MTEENKNANTVVQNVLNSLLADITNGIYKPGTKLPNEFALMEKFNVSRNSLREAIKCLSVMGIVQIKRGNGTYVCSQVQPSIFDSAIYSMISDESSSAEMLELRQIIDETVVRLAFEKITSDEMQALQKNIQKMKEAIAQNDMKLAQNLDYQFHNMLIESCKNGFYIRMAKGAYSIFRHSIGENVSLERVDSLAPYFHEKILKCINEKDYQNLTKIVENSLITWRERLQ